jgi:hypothetical protein
MIRDLVWGQLYGSGFEPSAVHDVDVAFFDPHDLDRTRHEYATGILRALWRQVPRQARNQAAVHTWYAEKFGGDPVAALSSIAEAVATWPETATAVVVRLNRTDEIEVCAPLGLADLLGGCGGEILAGPACPFPCSAWPGTTPRSAGRGYGSFCDYGNHGGQHRDP